MTAESNQTGSRWAAALVVAGLTALAYYYAYRYELGYCSHFGIPRELVSVGIVELLNMTAKLLGLFGLGIIFARAVYMYASNKWKRQGQKGPPRHAEKGPLG